jgi:hypothetical protein
MFVKIVGWTFFLMCPFVGGPLAIVAVLSALEVITPEAWPVLYGGWSVIWVVLYALWFDGSKYQLRL